MGRRAIIKFGGADLASGRRIKKAAQMVVDSDHDEIVVVVSAMGKTTDTLVNLLAQLDVCERDHAEIISMGEQTSAKVFASAIKELGGKSVCFLPGEEGWPIITDSRCTDATPDLQVCRRKMREYLEPHLGESIVVICGFIGTDPGGCITTLGRGGSDTTALVVGNCLEADEVILVKDTEGLLTADPELVQRCEPIEEIHIEELFALAHGGARIVHHKGLKYKLPGQSLRIVPFSKDDLDNGGTRVIGEFSSNMEIKQKNGLSSVTVICDLDAANLSSIFTAIDGAGVSGISSGERSITIFGEFQVEKLLPELHRSIASFKAISHREGVGMLEVTHPRFVDDPGWVTRITDEISGREINMIEVTTSKATICIYLDDHYLAEAVDALENRFIEDPQEDIFQDEAPKGTMGV